MPRQSVAAWKAVAKWNHANQALEEALELRDDAFRGMVRAGMVGNHIARVTGLTRAGVRYLADELDVKLRTLPVKSPQTIMKRRARVRALR